MEVKNLNLVPPGNQSLNLSNQSSVNPNPHQPIEDSPPSLSLDSSNHLKNGENQHNQNKTPPGELITMDVVGSLRKISRELLELDPNQPDLLNQLEAASWLIRYISDGLETELQHAVERGKKMSGMNGNVETKVNYSQNSEGQRIYGIVSGDQI